MRRGSPVSALLPWHPRRTPALMGGTKMGGGYYTNAGNVQSQYPPVTIDAKLAWWRGIRKLQCYFHDPSVVHGRPWNFNRPRAIVPAQHEHERSELFSVEVDNSTLAIVPFRQERPVCGKLHLEE